MSVPWDLSVSSPGIGDHGRRRSRNTRRLVVLSLRQVDAPKAKTCGQTHTKGRR
jgi:hypothetical protein